MMFRVIHSWYLSHMCLLDITRMYQDFFDQTKLVFCWQLTLRMNLSNTGNGQKRLLWSSAVNKRMCAVNVKVHIYIFSLKRWVQGLLSQQKSTLKDKLWTFKHTVTSTPHSHCVFVDPSFIVHLRRYNCEHMGRARQPKSTQPSSLN